MKRDEQTLCFWTQRLCVPTSKKDGVVFPPPPLDRKKKKQEKEKIEISSSSLLGKTISPVSFAKDLGVFTDQYLTYDIHITKTASNCMNQLVQISRIKHLFDVKTLLLLINSFVFYFIVPQCGGTHLNVIYTNCSWF